MRNATGVGAVCAVIIAILLATALPVVAAARLRVVAAPYAPFVMADAQGKPRGIMYEIAVEMMARLEARGSVVPPENGIELLPWKRAYAIALDRPDTLLFPLAVTPRREDLFLIVGNIIAREVWLFADRRRVSPLQGPQDLGRDAVGVVMGLDLAERIPTQFGFLTYEVSDESILVRMLLRGRLTYIAHDPVVVGATLDQLRLEFPEGPQQIAPLFSLFIEGYRAMGLARDSSPELYAALNDVFDELRREGGVRRVIARYRSEFCPEAMHPKAGVCPPGLAMP